MRRLMVAAACALLVVVGAPITSASAASESVNLRGSVRLAGGTAVDGASIEALDPGSAVVASGDTGGDGTYAFDVPPGTYDIRVRMPANGGGVRKESTTTGVAVDGTRPFNVVIASPSGSSVSVGGTVRNGSQLLAGVDVTFSQDNGGNVFTTDSSGAFTGFAYKGSYDIVVRKPSRMWNFSVSSPFDVTGPAQDLDLLLPTRVLTVRVVDGNGTAVPGASVARPSGALPVEARPGVVGSGTMLGSVPTDSTGSAPVEILDTSASFAVTVTPSSSSGLARRTVDVPANATSVDVVLERAPLVRGLVRDSSGNAVAGASVALVPPPSSTNSFPSPVAYGTTDGDGAYSIPGYPGAFRVGVSVSSGSYPGPYSSVGETADVELVGADTAVVDLTVPHMSSNTVRVVAAGGAAAKGASVNLSGPPTGSWPPLGQWSSSSGTTNDLGEVMLPAIDAGDLTLNVTPASGFGTTTVTSDRGTIEATLPTTVALTGRLTLDGSPVSDGQMRASVTGTAGSASASTGADGSFALDVVPGTSQLSVNYFVPGLGNRSYYLGGPVEIGTSGRAIDLDVPLVSTELRSSAGLSTVNMSAYSSSNANPYGTFPFTFGDGAASGNWGHYVNVSPAGATTVTLETLPADDVRTYLNGSMSVVHLRMAEDQVLFVADPVDPPAPVDSTPPTISAVLSSPGVHVGDWYDSDVTVSFVCSDAESEIASCTSPVVVSTEGVAQPVVGTAVDGAGNEASVTAYVSIDKSAPTIAAAVSPAAPMSGWHQGSVNVSFACSDGLSGVVSCPSPVSVTADGVHEVPGSAVDAVGHTSNASATVKIDATAPDTFVAPVLRARGRVSSISGSASDATSGVSRVVVTYSRRGIVVQTVEASVGAPVDGVVQWTAATPARGGRYDVSVVSCDAAGNVDPTPAVATLSN